MMLSLLLLSCQAEKSPVPPTRLLEALGMEQLTRAPLEPLLGEPLPYPGYQVIPVSLQVLKDFRVSGALFLPDQPAPLPTILIPHGHFGEGKSSGESQAPAHAFARSGWAALTMDSPGVEEGDLPGRRIHLREGAGGRALLAAAGSSAMGAQLHCLQAALDFLETRPELDPRRVAVAGASGGSVQGLYLSLIDPRVKATVLASYVPMPREARAGGCACDTLPGWPGPDSALLESLATPSLWLTEYPQEAPAGLPRGGKHLHVEGPHGFEPAMIKEALDWLEEELDAPRVRDALSTPLPHSPSSALQSAHTGEARWRDLLRELPGPVPQWTPRPQQDVSIELDCAPGAGPKVLILGDSSLAAGLSEAGGRPCQLTVQEDEAGLAQAIAEQGAYADRFLGAALKAQRQSEAKLLLAQRGWGVIAEAMGQPYLLVDPLERLDQLREDDPSWVHTPGGWWRGDRHPSALWRGEDRQEAFERAIALTSSQEGP